MEKRMPIQMTLHKIINGVIKSIKDAEVFWLQGYKIIDHMVTYLKPQTCLSYATSVSCLAGKSFLKGETYF